MTGGLASNVVELLGWILAAAATSVPVYMIWAYAKRAAELNKRIAACDPSLLTDDGLNVSRLMAVPDGTQYIENAEIIAAPVPHLPVQPSIPLSER